jgi:hypothetical protein
MGNFSGGSDLVYFFLRYIKISCGPTLKMSLTNLLNMLNNHNRSHSETQDVCEHSCFFVKEVGFSLQVVAVRREVKGEVMAHTQCPCAF